MRGAGPAPSLAVPALKEGRAAVRALEAGRQVVLLRRGGLRERAFEAQALPARFALLPTEFHASHVRAESFASTGPAPPAAATVCAGPGEVALSSYAQLTGAWAAPPGSARELFEAMAVEGLHIWSNEFYSARLERAKPGPTSVLELRVYVLEQPICVPEADFTGCFSWVDLGPSLEPSGAVSLPSLLDAPANPALGFLDFSRQQAALRAQLERVAPGAKRITVCASDAASHPPPPPPHTI